jgi:hypothetical protein
MAVTKTAKTALRLQAITDFRTAKAVTAFKTAIRAKELRTAKAADFKDRRVRMKIAIFADRATTAIRDRRNAIIIRAATAEDSSRPALTDSLRKDVFRTKEKPSNLGRKKTTSK